ncbi:MAG: sulfatase, partial [Acidobacteriota bacterium]
MPLASVLHEIETVDVGGADDRRWLRDGGSIVGARGMDTTIRWITSESATLELWLARPRDVEMVWTGWPLNFPDAPVQAIRFEANGRTLGSFELDHGWQPREYRVTWPASAQRRGPNLIRLVPSTRHVPADVIEDAEDPRALASAWSSLRLEWSRFADEPWVRERTTRPTLALPVGSRIEFFIQPTGPATLEIDRLAVAGEVSAGAPDLRVSVLADRGEEQSVDLSAGSAEPLSMLLQETDQPLRIAFEAIADDETAAVLQLVAPRLVIEPSESERSTESQGDGTVTSPPVESASTEPWNVLIYVVDSLRADHLGCYGYDRPTSPELDRFAADAVRFEQVVAQASWTRATVASMLTGLYPHAHGAVGREDVLAETTPYLAEILKAAGYATAGFVTNENVAALFGFGRGYDIYHHFPEDDELVEHHVLSDALNDVLFQWLEERDPERPFFLYAHASDPHYPYRPRSPFLERFAGSV